MPRMCSESEKIVGVKMKVLVFLLAVLGCSLVEGVIVAKCDLRDQLKSMINSLPVTGGHRVLSRDNTVARLVCHADKSSGFNTNALTERPAGTLDNTHSGQQLTQFWQNLQNNSHSPPPPQEAMLYGIFQLSNRIACNDSVNSTHNICEIPCSNLIDDNISDDVQCLLNLFKNVRRQSSDPSSSSSHQRGSRPPFYKLRKMMPVIFQVECMTIQAADYFAGCPPPPN